MFNVFTTDNTCSSADGAGWRFADDTYPHSRHKVPLRYVDNPSSSPRWKSGRSCWTCNIPNCCKPGHICTATAVFLFQALVVNILYWLLGVGHCEKFFFFFCCQRHIAQRTRKHCKRCSDDLFCFVVCRHVEADFPRTIQVHDILRQDLSTRCCYGLELLREKRSHNTDRSADTYFWVNLSDCSRCCQLNNLG